MLIKQTMTFEKAFNEEERAIIKECCDRGAYAAITSKLEEGNQEMTPEREAALQEYLNEIKPVKLDGESAVAAELQKWEQEGNRIETPEQESEWQAKFDRERAEKAAKLKNLTKEESKEDGLTKTQIMEELKNLNISFKPIQSKAELYDLLEKSKITNQV